MPTTKEILKKLYRNGDALDEMQSRQARRDGQDTIRDLSITVKKSPERLAYEARLAQEREAEAARQAEARANAAELAELERAERERYLHAGGNERDFDSDYWPQRRREIIAARVGQSE